MVNMSECCTFKSLSTSLFWRRIHKNCFDLINIQYAARMLPRKVIDDEGYTVGV